MAAGAPALHDFLTDNIADEISMSFGEPDRAFAESEHIREDEFSVQPTHSAFSEHHIVLADFSLSDRLTIWTPIQSSAIIKSSMARNLGLTDSNVRIVNLHTGGAFCGRGADKPHHYIAALSFTKSGQAGKNNVYRG